MVELRHLRYFKAVADYGSIAVASRHLNIVQPALSRQIRDLERGLGFALFLRNSKGVSLTPAGRNFFESSRKILQDVERAREQASLIARGVRGTMRVGISPSYNLLNRPGFAGGLLV